LRVLGFAIAALLIAVAAQMLFFGSRQFVSTENAYVKGHRLSLAMEVNGRITSVAVDVNDTVEQGQLLLRIDDTPYRLAVAEAEANLARARNDIDAMQAEYTEAQASLAQSREDAAFYTRELRRSEQLSSVAVSEAQIDSARQDLRRAESAIRVGEQRLARLRAELGGNPDMPVGEHPEVRAAQAQLERARYELERTVLYAPTSGVIANSVPEVGEMAAPGIPLLTMLDSSELWMEANLKETQLAAVRPGQAAKVSIDAYPGEEFDAEVESLSPASGSEFALIPAQNASGNWVKVVQRVPVRLRLLDARHSPPLRAGLSAEVVIDTGAKGAALAATP